MVLTVYAFIQFTWTQQHSTQNMENWKIKTIMFLQSAMLFAEMSYLTDERCFRAARGITPFTQTLPHIATWVTGLRGSHRSPPKRWGLAWPCICACPASPSRGEVSEFRKGVVAALFQLCLGGERWDKAISEPWLCHHSIGFQSLQKIKYQGLCWFRWKQ